MLVSDLHRVPQWQACLVLILVLVDVGLGHFLARGAMPRIIVLILVLVDVGLGPGRMIDFNIKLRVS